jgi:amino acid transporter
VNIDWASLATVAVVATAAALTIVLLISFAVVTLSRSTRRADGRDGDDAPVTHTGVGTAIAALCVLAAGLIVFYGLYLIII